MTRDPNTFDRVKNTILEAWAETRNDDQRQTVLSAASAARHEIFVELLGTRPELRIAIERLEGLLTAIAFGKYTISAARLYDYDTKSECPGSREAPLVGAAGYVAMLLALEAEHKERMHRELRGSETHACRIQDAHDARSHRARPTKGATGYVEPLDPMEVGCIVCRAPAGEKCAQPKKE